MIYSDESYVQMSGEVLKPLCEKALENILAARKKDDEKDIAKKRRRLYIFFGRFETDEEVVARLSEPDCYGFAKFPSTRAYMIEGIAKTLLNMLAKSKDNTVWVSSEDFAWIEHWAY